MHPDRLVRWGQRGIGVGTSIFATGFALIFLTLPSSAAPTSLDWRLAVTASSHGFNLFTWEIRTLADRTFQAIASPAQPSGVDVVERYVRLSAEDARARQARDEEWARRDVLGNSPDLVAAQQRLDSVDGELARLRPAVEATVSAEVEAELRAQGVRTGLLTWEPLSSLPFYRPVVTPGVFFQLGPPPDLLVVAPTDQIQIIDSVLIQPGLPPDQVDGLESRADGLGLSSVVTGIGGLAAYPSMLPDTASAQDLLITVSHEWTHHYLALRPLGTTYFDSYQMREINETVADMVGHEVGQAIYRHLYPPPLAARPAPSQAPAAPPRPDFWTLMRQIRVAVEGYLTRHDVAGANLYMTEQRQELAKDGYYVRRLNTAYLAFFGSYAGSANPFEPKLRRLRERSGSLAAFLDAVSKVRTPADLDRLAAQ